jgi:hypothetical protein
MNCRPNTVTRTTTTETEPPTPPVQRQRGKQRPDQQHQEKKARLLRRSLRPRRLARAGDWRWLSLRTTLVCQTRVRLVYLQFQTGIRPLPRYFSQKEIFPPRPHQSQSHDESQPLPPPRGPPPLISITIIPMYLRSSLVRVLM